jgi:hypothetical protein
VLCCLAACQLPAGTAACVLLLLCAAPGIGAPAAQRGRWSLQHQCDRSVQSATVASVTDAKRQRCSNPLLAKARTTCH